VREHSAGLLRLKSHGAPIDEQRQADAEVLRALAKGAPTGSGNLAG